MGEHDWYIITRLVTTQNVALSALLFLCREVLRIDLPRIDHIEWARRLKRLPVVFSRPEVEAVLDELAKINPSESILTFSTAAAWPCAAHWISNWSPAAKRR